MASNSSAPAITPSLPTGDGSRPPSWRSARVFIATKTCEHCDAPFRPWIKRDAEGNVLSFMKENHWKRQRFCSISCSKKHENPMADSEARLRKANTLREMGHRPLVRGGNGTGLTAPQAALLEALGLGWVAELAVPTRIARGNGYPTCYKLDLANPKLMIGVELDGYTHTGERVTQDRKKNALLASFGWKVCRVPNKVALKLSTTCRSPDILLSSLMEYSSTTAI